MFASGTHFRPGDLLLLQSHFKKTNKHNMYIHHEPTTMSNNSSSNFNYINVYFPFILLPSSTPFSPYHRANSFDSSPTDLSHIEHWIARTHAARLPLSSIVKKRHRSVPPASAPDILTPRPKRRCKSYPDGERDPVPQFISVLINTVNVDNLLVLTLAYYDAAFW